MNQLRELNFNEWRKRFIKQNSQGKRGPLAKTNLFIQKIQFKRRSKSIISLRDIQEVIDEMEKELNGALQDAYVMRTIENVSKIIAKWLK